MTDSHDEAGLPAHLRQFQAAYDALPADARPAAVARWTRSAADADRRFEAALRLQARFGNGLERQWARDPNGPRLPAQELMILVAAAGDQRPGGDRPRPTASDVQDALALAVRARSDLDYQEERLIDLARSQTDDRRRLTWAEIAKALGMGSAQAAQQRYRRRAGDTDPLSPGDHDG